MALMASERIMGVHGGLYIFLSRPSSTEQATLRVIYSALSQIGESIPAGQPAGASTWIQNHSPKSAAAAAEGIRTTFLYINSTIPSAFLLVLFFPS